MQTSIGATSTRDFADPGFHPWAWAVQRFVGHLSQSGIPVCSVLTLAVTRCQLMYFAEAVSFRLLR